MKKEHILAAVLCGSLPCRGFLTPTKRHLTQQRDAKHALHMMSDMSDSELHASLQSRLRQLQVEQEQQQALQSALQISNACEESDYNGNTVIAYDAQAMKQQYYNSFWRARNLKRKRPESLPMAYNYYVPPQQQQQQQHNTEQESAESARVPSAAVYGWSAEELLSAYQSYAALAQSLRSLAAADETADARTPQQQHEQQQQQQLFDWDALKQPEYLHRVELKHSRVAMLAFAACATRDCLSSYDLSVLGHTSALNAVLALMVSSAAMYEANSYWSQGRASFETWLNAEASRALLSIEASVNKMWPAPKEHKYGIPMLAHHIEVGSAVSASLMLPSWRCIRVFPNHSQYLHQS